MRTARFRARVPYGVEHALGRGILRPGELRFRRNRTGVACGVIASGDRHRPIGRVLALDERPDGLHFEIELAEDAADRASTGGYFVEPQISRGTLLALEITVLESWPSAELRPAGSAPRVPSSPVAPIPPRPDVNLQPIATALFSVPPRPRP